MYFYSWQSYQLAAVCMFSLVELMRGECDRLSTPVGHALLLPSSLGFVSGLSFESSCEPRVNFIHGSSLFISLDYG